MVNKYRLASGNYDRELESEKVSANKIFFLSVEGNDTETEYFQSLSRNRGELGICALVDVEVLGRRKSDTNSAPLQVIELLEEYIRLRETNEQSQIEEIPKGLIDEYGIDFVQAYLNNPNDTDNGTRKQRNTFTEELMKIGYDAAYRKYLRKCSKDYDEFAVLIDRDKGSHSVKNMEDCVAYCKKQGYGCYITNPCFEFWLLLHLSDVKCEYADCLEEIARNEKVSNSHTYVSKIVSEKAHHTKSGIGFEKNYLPHVDEAIKRANEFATDENLLIHELGTNIGQFIKKMRASSMNETKENL